MSGLPELEVYTPERIAEFLLSNSVSEEDYRRNLAEVLALGDDPLSIDPAFLIQDEPWQRPDRHRDILPARRTS
jgi:hypothetical protein